MATEEFTINTLRRGLAAAGVVALITTGATACGGDEPSTPQGKVSKALASLGEQKSVTVGLSFDGTAQQIYDGAKSAGDDFTLDDAKLLSQLHLTAAYSADKPLSGLHAGSNDHANVAVALTSGDGKDAKNLVGIRSVDKTLYVQADIKGFEALDPGNSDFAEIDGLLDSVDQLPDSFASVKALAHGGWVSLDIKSFTEFFKSLGGDSADGSGSGDGSDDSGLGLPGGLPTALPSDLAGKTLSELLTPLQESLTKDATLTDLGTKDGADHIKASIPAKKLAADLKDALSPLTKSLPGDLDKELDDVPDETLNLDLAIKGGELTAITIDLGELSDDGPASLPLTLSIDGGAEQIKAPSGAKQLNPQDLMGVAMQMFNDQSGSDSFDS